MDYTELKSKDGTQTWRLRYNNRALRWFEKQSGLKIMEIDESALGMNEITCLLAAGLLHENRNITIEDADDVIDAVGMKRSYELAMEALQRDLADDDPDAELQPLNGTASKNAVSGAGHGQR